MIKYYFFVLSALFLISCKGDAEKVVANVHVEKEQKPNHIPDPALILRLHMDSIYQELGLVALDRMDRRILIDLRYAGTNNFLGQVLYDSIQTIYLAHSVAERLIKVQEYLDSIKPGYRLKVFDGLRPTQVQKIMWKALDSVPALRRGIYVSNPSHGSLHNFGAAVDLTIVDQNNKELDMGAAYDDFRSIAQPSKESYFITRGELLPVHVANRQLLRKVMRNQRFVNIPGEWWHFNACSRSYAGTTFHQLLTESGQVRPPGFYYYQPKADSLNIIEESKSDTIKRSDLDHHEKH